MPCATLRSVVDSLGVFVAAALLGAFVVGALVSAFVGALVGALAVHLVTGLSVAWQPDAEEVVSVTLAVPSADCPWRNMVIIRYQSSAPPPTSMLATET